MKHKLLSGRRPLFAAALAATFITVTSLCACIDEFDEVEDELGLEDDAFRAKPKGGTCITPPSGMRLWHSYDESTGPTAFDYSFAPGAAHGTHVAVTPGVAGEVASALEFNGSTSAVIVPDEPVLDLDQSSFAVDFWIRPNVGEQRAMLLRKGIQSALPSGAGQLDEGFQISWNGTAVFVTLASAGASTIRQIGGVNSITPGQWNFVAINVDRVAETAQLWINGVDNGLLSMPNPGSITTSADLVIGDNGIHATDWSFDGSLDELELFGRVLTVAEVAALYIAGPNGKCKTCPPESETVNYASTDPEACAGGDIPAVLCSPSMGWQSFDNHCGCGCIQVSGGGQQ